MSVPVLTRRRALTGGLLVVAGAVAGYFIGLGTPAAADRRGTTAANASGGGGSLLLPLANVPPGGGVVVGRAKVVVTKTATGEVHAFSAVCTHQGCLVDRVAHGTISCPCHGSAFDAATGAVTSGPATRPLPPVGITVRSGNVYSA
jgi:Rieske Fe-S protein